MSAGSDRRLVLRPVRVAIAAGVLVLVIVGILLIVLIGPTDEEQIEELTLAYGQAEEAAACEYLSTEAIQQLGDQEGCEQAFEGVPAVAFEIESIALDDEVAEAQVLNTQSDEPFVLGYVEEDGEWKISQFPGLEQPIVPPDQPTPTLPDETETGETDAPEAEPTETDETETETDETDTETETTP